MGEKHAPVRRSVGEAYADFTLNQCSMCTAYNKINAATINHAVCSKDCGLHFKHRICNCKLGSIPRITHVVTHKIMLVHIKVIMCGTDFHQYTSRVYGYMDLWIKAFLTTEHI